MPINPELIEFFILRYGFLGVLVILLILLVSNPDRAEKLKALIIWPLYRCCKRGSRAYLASEISYQTTVFFHNHLQSFMPSLPDVKVRIKWVTSASDPVLQRDGTLILRIRETNDQTRNILSAARVALPQILCSTLRSHLDDYAASAIDLTVLRKLADKLGRHAHPIFQRYFLAPEVQEDERAVELFTKLVTIDRAGIFVSIFLEELNTLGSVIYSTGESIDITSEVIQFLDFLLELANRDVGQEIQLNFHSKHLDIGLLLLARSYRAATEGTVPYIRRVERYLTVGCESIYIVAYPPARDFLPRILKVVEGNQRLTVSKTNKIHLEGRNEVGFHEGISTVVLLRSNTIFGHSVFEEKLGALGIRENVRISGTVLDVSQDKAVIDVGGINGTITRGECSWNTVFACKDHLQDGSSYQFLVTGIDKDTHKIHLSRRFPESDPWRSKQLPKEGQTVTVKVTAVKATDLLCSYDAGLEFLLPMHEISWLSSRSEDPNSLIGTEQKIIIMEVNEKDRIVRCSIRRLSEDPWPDIHKRYPKGTQMRGTVIEVTENFVRIQLPEGMSGIIPKESMERAGFEYADFRNSVVPGQGFDVVVTKVFLKKRRIRLDLRRNVVAEARGERVDEARQS